MSRPFPCASRAPGDTSAGDRPARQEKLALCGGLTRQILLERHLDRRQAGGACERIAAERGGVDDRIGIITSQTVGVAMNAESGITPPPMDFPEAHDVGDHVPVVHAPEFAGTPHAGLNLVGDEESAVPGAELAGAGK